MAEPIVVVGAGGFGREVLDVIEAINNVSVHPVWEVVGVVDDAPSVLNLSRLSDRGYKHLGPLAGAELPEGCFHMVGIGSPAVRAHVARGIAETGGRFATLIHPTAQVGSRAIFGPGSVLCSAVVVSTNVSLGSHVHLNPGVIIGHDTVLADLVSVNPGAVVSGEVVIKAGVLVGAAAMVLQGLCIGENAIIGASACVTRDVATGTSVKGVPAR